MRSARRGETSAPVVAGVRHPASASEPGAPLMAWALA